MELDESSPFMDLTDEVHFDTAFGMMGMAFHPNFAQNGRLFASFNCDKVKWPGCTGRCSCNSDVDCDPSKLSSDNGAQPCQYQTVIAEYSTNGTASQPSLVLLYIHSFISFGYLNSAIALSFHTSCCAFMHEN